MYDLSDFVTCIYLKNDLGMWGRSCFWYLKSRSEYVAVSFIVEDFVG